MDVEFRLKYKLANTKVRPEALVERLHAAGCNDALVGMGSPGYLSLEFARKAESAEAAVLTALFAVRRAIPDAELVEVAGI